MNIYCPKDGGYCNVEYNMNNEEMYRCSTCLALYKNLVNLVEVPE